MLAHGLRPERREVAALEGDHVLPDLAAAERGARVGGGVLGFLGVRVHDPLGPFRAARAKTPTAFSLQALASFVTAQ